MKRTNNDLSVKWGSITFPSEFIDITTYKPSTKKITSSDSGRSKALVILQGLTSPHHKDVAQVDFYSRLVLVIPVN